VANHMLQLLYPKERAPVPIVQEDKWASGPTWTDAENLAATKVMTQNRPLHSSLLYWLFYPGFTWISSNWKFVTWVHATGDVPNIMLNTLLTSWIQIGDWEHQVHRSM